MIDWFRVTHRDSLPAREGRSVQLAGRDIALFNLVDRIVAVDNQCPHRGGPLCDGIVSGSTVVCPLHGWKVNIVDGQIERPAGADCQPVEVYPVRIDDGVIVVGVPA